MFGIISNMISYNVSNFKNNHLLIPQRTTWTVGYNVTASAITCFYINYYVELKDKIVTKEICFISVSSLFGLKV